MTTLFFENKTMKNLFFCIMLLAFFSCGKQEKSTEPEVETDYLCSCPPAFKVHLQPLNGFSQKEAKQVKEELDKHLLEMGIEGHDIDILPNTKLDSSYLNDFKTRYSAQKILGSLKKGKVGEVYIGLLHEDISLPLRGQKDWGVQGLSSINGNASVISTFRVANRKSELWKIVAHEFVHTFASVGHCKNDADTCLMQDAKGHPKWSKKKDLCDTCKEAFYKAQHKNNIGHPLN